MGQRTTWTSRGVQMCAAMQDFLGGVCTHLRMSLQYGLNMMPLRWEGMRRCIEFWVKVLRLNEDRLRSDVGSLGALLS